MGEANRRMKGQWSDSIWILYEVLYLLQNQKFKLLVPERLPSNSWVYHGGSWRLSNYHIQERKKESFKDTWFSKNSFFQKKMALEMCHLFAQPNCENKSFEPDHQISSKCPIQRFSNSDHQFFGSLKSKGKMTFHE